MNRLISPASLVATGIISLLSCAQSDEQSEQSLRVHLQSTAPMTVDQPPHNAAREAQPRTESTHPAPKLSYEWTNVGPLHRGFIGDPERGQRLREQLNILETPEVTLSSSWSDHNASGSLRLRLYTPNVLSQDQNTHSRWAILGQVAQAMTDFRAQIGGRFDIRLLSFEIELETVQGCVFNVLERTSSKTAVLSPCFELSDKSTSCAKIDDSGQLEWSVRGKKNLLYCTSR